MKTLDEVIKAIEYCLNPADKLGNCNGDCPYCPSCDPEGTVVKLDALYYLKQYHKHLSQDLDELRQKKYELETNMNLVALLQEKPWEKRK